ncbi:uncharacterized protein Z518_09297 [Rhinocladiella mackenziei CBS 650.93]|uniref:Uncharacterized protein n=1 Tax=Rhinocladiella mackenziei CBS 650.93 TaxID=1442369 RepID=A0A0D2IEA4_9EURO|nr:uncharacterized protein Z518_09297 [Rhinocladiella mackenziei CBS 650.93]KIX01571.1 hypothetical protein Z518_09297 [Rhinocladiella mackenziei CBS 650.93]
MATKKIFVGSLFEFSQLGADELIRNFKDAHDDPESAPFVAFEESTQTFSAEVDKGDRETMLHLLARLSGYIEYNQTNQPGFDDEPRIRPMDGIVMEDVIRDDRSEDNGLLEYWSDDESDGQDALESLQHLIAYWKPRNGDISILPSMYAQEINRLTGTSLFAEEAEKRYRLFQGDFRLALEKLSRLEPLLETFKKQHNTQSIMATGNVLIWPPNQKDATIQFVKIQFGHPAYSRVIVNKMEQTLFKKVIGELRTRTSDLQLAIPGNLCLEDISQTSQIQGSRIWDGSVFESFGDPKNMEPIISSNPASTESSKWSAVQDPNEARITAWTNKVASGADPEIAPEEPAEPVEPPQPMRRRVAIDSDSDDDESSVPLPQTRPIEKSPMAAPPDPKLLENQRPESPVTESLLSSNIPLTVVRGDSDENYVSGKSEGKTLIEDEDAIGLIENFPPLPISAREASISDWVTNLPHNPARSRDNSESGPTSPSSGTGDGDMQATTFIEPRTRSSLEGAQPSVERNQVRPAPSFSALSAFTAPKVPSTPSSPHPELDPNAYWPSSKLVRGQPGAIGPRAGSSFRSAGNRGGRAQVSNTHAQVTRRTEHASHHGHSGYRGNSSRVSAPPGRSTRGRGSRGDSFQHQQRNLVDTRSSEVRYPPVIPPGFESRVPLIRQQQSQALELHRKTDTPSQQPSPLGRQKPSSCSRSATSGESRIRFSDEGADYTATFIPKKNHALLRENSLRAAMEAIAARNTQNDQTPNRKAVDDDTPPLHSTMNQQGKNPGKKPMKQETKAERKERVEKAKLDAYGPAPTKVPQQLKTATDTPLEEMSRWKRKQISKNLVMAEAHPQIVESNLRDRQCSTLLRQLEPIFETGRAFNGKLLFEIQLGQVLVSPGPQFLDRHYYDVAAWSSLFDPETAASHTPTTFTKILTTNGADVDRVLELKASSGSGNNKLWSPCPGPQSTSYEFSCQSRSNEDFLIMVDQSGNHELRKGIVTVGMVNMHAPAHIWDASATLSGHLKWANPSKMLTKSASSFVNSLYVVPRREKLMIVFRQPNDHEIKIRNLIVRRVSCHRCNLPGYADIQLKVTEAKSLMFKVHPQDKKLWQGYEGPREDYDKLAREGRIHYELSLVHTGINEVLAQNESLEIGELTDGETTGKSLINRAVIRSMLEVAVQMISRIDFVGMRNFGTQERLDMEEEERRRNLEASLGPAGKTVLQAPTLLHSGSVSRLHPPASPSHALARANSRLTSANIPVHGVRMNTVAEIVQAPDGSRYARGIGGARVPVAEEVLSSSRTVAPEDSASQVGGPGRTSFYSSWSQGPNRGAGFW